MKIDILTLFPRMLEGFVSESIVGRAVRKQLLAIHVHNLRDWAEGNRKTVDDRPFGGGAGMVLRFEPLFSAITDLKKQETRVIYLCPDGIPLSTSKVKMLAQEKHLLFVSGHYEGVDERFRKTCVDEEISIGDYVLTNGTLASVVLLDAVARYIPGVLGAEQSLEQDSFRYGLLSFAQYTRPEVFCEQSVPDILLNGNHEAIARWRLEQRILRTLRQRPDLIFNN